MNQKSSLPSKSVQPGVFGTLNPQKVVILILRNWYVYLAALIIFTAGAVLYLKHKIPSYSVSTTILIEEEESGMPGGEDLLQGTFIEHQLLGHSLLLLGRPAS